MPQVRENEQFINAVGQAVEVYPGTWVPSRNTQQELRDLVARWVEAYAGSLDRVFLGADEANAHREGLYLGNRFSIQHGEFVEDTLSVALGGERLGYRLAPVVTPVPETTLGHLLPALLKKIGELDKELLENQTEFIKRGVKNSGVSEYRTKNWRLEIRDRSPRDPSHKLEFTLFPRRDDALERKKIANMVGGEVKALPARIQKNAIERTIAAEQAHNYQVSSISISELDEAPQATTLANIADAIAQSDSWRKIDDPQEVSEVLDHFSIKYVYGQMLDRCHFFLPKDQTDPQYVMIAYEDLWEIDHTSTVEVLLHLSHDVQNKAKEEFIEAMKPWLAEKVISVTEDDEDWGRNLSPKSIIVSALREREDDPWGDEDQAVRDLWIPTALLLRPYMSEHIQGILDEWVEAIQSHSIVSVRPLQEGIYRETVGGYTWNVSLDVGDGMVDLSILRDPVEDD